MDPKFTIKIHFMKTAFVHDWLVSPIGGAENTLREMYSIFPSPIYTLLWNPKAFEKTSFESAEVISSFIKRLPWAKTRFRSYLPLFPLGIEQFDLSSYDLVLSSSHCVAHGALTHAEQLHICYCHTPMRYAWDLSHEYLKESKLDRGIRGAVARFFLHYLRSWDSTSSRRVDYFIANSKFIARRILKIYGRDSEVIYPPVDTSFFSLCDTKEDYYITSSRLVSYKKIDLIVEAFAEMPDLKLIVIGDGPEAKKIKQKAKQNIDFLGFQPNEVLRYYLQKAKAFVFAAVEDFGITPIEAMACGTPVVALRKGGTAETILDQKTGLFFEEQTVSSIKSAIREFEQKQRQFNPFTIQQHASTFSAERFRKEFKGFVHEKLQL